MMSRLQMHWIIDLNFDDYEFTCWCGLGCSSQSTRKTRLAPFPRLPIWNDNASIILKHVECTFLSPGMDEICRVMLLQKGAICINRFPELGVIRNAHFCNSESGYIAASMEDVITCCPHHLFAKLVSVFEVMAGKPSILYLPRK